MMPKINRLTGRFFTVLISLSLAICLPRMAFAGGTKSPSPTLCQISDTVYRADGTPAQGTVLVSWQAFTTAAGQAVSPGSMLVTLDSSGGFNASLAPNTGASPAGSYYRAIFKLDDGTTETEIWVIPNAQTTTIGAIRSKLVPAQQAAQFLTRDFADSTYVGLASTQTITGVKTFNASPAVPTPQNPTDAANKAYVDANGGSGLPSGSGNEVLATPANGTSGAAALRQAVSADLAPGLTSPPPIGSVTPNTVAATTLTTTDSRTGLFPYVDVRAYGAVGDALGISGCSITATQTQLTCTSANLNSASVGKTIIILGAGTSDSYASPLITTIASYTSATTVSLTAAAVQTVTGIGIGYYGTDNATAFCNAAQCTQAVYTGVFSNGALTGRELYIPGGAYLTTKPVYGRNNLGIRGAPQAGTQIFLASTQNALPTETTVSFATANITPVVCMGNATAGTGTCTADAAPASGSSSVYDLVASSPGMRTPAFLATSIGQPGGTTTSGVYLHNVWPEGYYGVVGYKTTVTSLDGVECDTGTHDCIIGVGDGSAAHFNSWQITNSQLGLAYWGIWLNGMQDVVISGNNSSAATNADIVIYSPAGNNAYRVTIAGNDFTATPGYAGPLHIDLKNPCLDCSIVHNKFANSAGGDISLESGASGTTNLLVSKNHFYGSTASSFTSAAGTSGSWIGEGNVWDAPGQYAVFSGNMNVKFDNNTCVNPFATTGPLSSNAYQSGCFYFTGGNAYTVEASNNSVTSSGSTKYPAVNLYGASAAISGSTSGNRSDYSGCAVCAYSSSSGLATSFNEVATNYGTSGTGLFSPVVAQQVNVIGDLTARDISGVEYFVSHYASIQAAINAAYNNGAVLGTVVDDRTAPYSGPGFILYDSVTLKLAATTYTITGTVTYNNGNNNVTAGIIAVSGAKLIGASTSTNHGTIITAGNGLNADLIATSTVGTGIGSAAQWWHWGGFENLRVTGNGANQTAGNCFNIENMGETAFLRTIEVSGCYLDNILFTGASATPSDIANITTNSAGRYGFNFNNLAGVAVVHGLSGDSNTTSLVRLNGGQSGTLTILGFKTEEEISGQDPLITIDETGQSGAQPSLFIVGGYTFGRNGVNDVIKYVNGTAGTTPYISVSNFYVQDYVNAVNDVVNSRTTAATNMNKVPFYYGPTGAFYSGQAFTLDLNTFVQSPHSGNYTLTEVFGTTSSNETLVAASGTSSTLSIGGIGFRMPNRSVFGQTPELFAKMTYAFPGGVPNTQQWEFIPAKVGGDNSTRWIGDPSYRWDEIYSADVNTTTATVGTLNVTTCNGCGPHLVSGSMQGPTTQITGTGSQIALYSATIPAGTFAVGTGMKCSARFHHSAGSAPVTMQWKLGSTAWTYSGTFTTGNSPCCQADIEILTPSALASEVVNVPIAAWGGNYQAPYTGLAWNENLANASTISLNFSVANTDKLTGDTFYCQTIQ